MRAYHQRTFTDTPKMLIRFVDRVKWISNTFAKNGGTYLGRTNQHQDLCPYAAIEESLRNAVYHKGCDVREPIEVHILPDRIEIVSHPGADRPILEEGLRTYRVFDRRYRNRRTERVQLILSAWYYSLTTQTAADREKSALGAYETVRSICDQMPVITEAVSR